MTRLLAAAVLLSLAAAPAFACDWNSSASNDAPQPGKVAAQPSADQSTPPPPAPSTQTQG